MSEPPVGHADPTWWTGPGRQGTPTRHPGEDPRTRGTRRAPRHCISETPLSVDPIAARLPASTWFGAGLLALAGGALGVVAATSPAADAGFGVAGVAAAAALATLGWRAGRVGQLPLEIGGRALRGVVDASPVLRFRARLGLGRPLRDARARVWFVGDGAERELTARVPAGTLVGPLTILAADPEALGSRAGRFRVELVVTARGREWRATREVPGPAAPGRFAAGGWADEEPDAG
jgi:hypothetical protein